MEQDFDQSAETVASRVIVAREKLVELARILARQAASELAASASPEVLPLRPIAKSGKNDD